VRKDDRGYQVGDILCLEEYDFITKEYTGRSINKVVTYILDGNGFFGLTNGFIVMGLRDQI
jgi:hypothetical protein